tara:strand:+ start:411 stop:620 length:210 start_codon:yes stop_codon:yes gene_type:complete
VAEFCQECHDQLLGHDIECGLAGLISEEDVKDGYVICVLCESCGFIQVDHEGKKVSWDNEENSSGDAGS